MLLWPPEMMTPTDPVSHPRLPHQSFGRRIPFSFLEDIRGRFMAAYGEACGAAVAYEFNAEFSKVQEGRDSCTCLE